MKIAIDVSQMCYEGTGVGRYTKELVLALLNLKSHHQFVLYAGALRSRHYFTELSNHSPWNKAEWKIFPLPPKLAGYAMSGTSIPFELLVGKVDLIHASDWSQPSAKAPIVTTVHDLVFRKYPETVDSLISNTQSRRLNKIVNSSTRIIADSHATEHDLIELYNLDPSRISVIYPGIAANYRPASTTEMMRVRAKYSLPEKFILSVGTQEPRKNLARLIEAANSMEIPLVLVGRYGWGDHTQTLGYVPDSDLPALYASATVFCYPSLYEGFGFPVLEAMACGAPVVTSNQSSLPEIAENAAILVNPLSVSSIQEGITQAIKSRDNLIKLGFAQAAKFTWDNTAKQVLEFYEKTAYRH